MKKTTPLRQQAMACVSLPTCPWRWQRQSVAATFIDRIDELMAKHGVADEVIITRITGCPNGCGRAMLAEIALVGKAPGRYNLHVGAI